MNSDLKIEGLKRFIDQREHLAFSGRLKDLGDRIQRHELIFSGKGTITTFLYADRDQQNRPVLHLKMTGDIQLICQKCLEAMDFKLDEEANLLLFSSEAALEAGIEENPDAEGLVIDKDEIEVHPLLEEQILLSLPLSPHHTVCENPVLKEINNDQPNPFQVLKSLKANN